MKITIDLKERSYPIYVNEEKRFTEVLKKRFPKSSFVVITNTTIAKLYQKTIKRWGDALPLQTFLIEDGEVHKSFKTWKAILDFLLKKRLDRNTVLIAFGGGVVGDISGFAASAFLRGVNYVQVPTTLLAMVDSSVGGKTAINHAQGKNLIGAFYQPQLVWIDTTFLKTLPKQEFLAGYGEVYKYAFIGGKSMFDFIRTNHKAIVSRKKDILCEAIVRSVKIKAKVVSEDEREAGKRALLNLGHTFGHALERFYNYKGLMHGEAVIWGILCAVKASQKVGHISSRASNTFDSILSLPALPKLPAPLESKKLYHHMFSDKKVRSGKIRFVLPVKPGVSAVFDDVDESVVLEALQEVLPNAR